MPAPNVRAKVALTVWRAGTAAQNWGEAPAPQAQCATPLGLSLSEGLGRTCSKPKLHESAVRVWCVVAERTRGQETLTSVEAVRR
jgi:hypothetical protein